MELFYDYTQRMLGGHAYNEHGVVRSAMRTRMVA